MPGVRGIFSIGVGLPGQVQHRGPESQALDLVLSQSEGRTDGDLVPLDPHVAHFDWEGGGEDRDTVPVDTLKGLVPYDVPFEQQAHRGVGAEDDVSVKAGESGYVESAQRERESGPGRREAKPSGWGTMPAAVPLAPFTSPRGVLMLYRMVIGIPLV